MKYLVFALLCSLSIAQAMDRGSLAQVKLFSIQSAIKQEEIAISSGLDALSKTIVDTKDLVTLYEKNLAIQRLKSRLTEVTSMLQWIQESNPAYSEISQAFINYQKTRDHLMARVTATKKTAAFWEGLAKKTPTQKAIAPATTLATFAEEDEEDEELVAEQAPARSQSVTVAAQHQPLITVATRAHSAPTTVHYSRSRYISPQSLESISETDEPTATNATHHEEEQPAGALTALFEVHISNV